MTRHWLSLALATLAIAALLYGVLHLIDLARSEPMPTCISSKDRDHLRALASDAIDHAFQAHVQKLFEIWIRDYSPEPERARVGMANGIWAYQRAKAMRWDQPTCRE